jgi:hypothetical protein
MSRLLQPLNSHPSAESCPQRASLLTFRGPARELQNAGRFVLNRKPRLLIRCVFVFSNTWNFPVNRLQDRKFPNL